MAKHIWTEDDIRAEMKRLDKLTGLHGSELPIQFSNARCTLGSYYFSNDFQEQKFTFSRQFFHADNFSEHSAIDVIRHEYAHYMNHAINPDNPGQTHGAKWKACCRKIGARPYAHYDRTLNLTFLHEEEEAEKHAKLRDAKLQPGTMVVHPSFGFGNISEVEGLRLVIDFAKVGNKKLSADWVLANCTICH